MLHDHFMGRAHKVIMRMGFGDTPWCALTGSPEGARRREERHQAGEQGAERAAGRNGGEPGQSAEACRARKFHCVPHARAQHRRPAHHPASLRRQVRISCLS